MIDAANDHVARSKRGDRPRVIPAQALGPGAREGAVVGTALVCYPEATTDRFSSAARRRRPEYLRIIDGPKYTSPEQLSQLRTRSLGYKRSLAGREFSLRIEALRRFVAGEVNRRPRS